MKGDRPNRADTVNLGAILATDAEITVTYQESGTVHVRLIDFADSVTLIGSPYALVDLACRIMTAVAKAVCDG